MTQNDQVEKSGMVSDIDSLLKAAFDPINQKIDPILFEYQAANDEGRNAAENGGRFKKSAEASEAAALAINGAIRACLMSREMGSKEAHKKRAERAGHLEDKEIYLSLAEESSVALSAAELKASKAASKIVDLTSQARSQALPIITDYLVSHFDDFRPLMLFLRFTEESARSGENALYNSSPNIHTPMEFAFSRLQAIIQAAFQGGISDEFGSAAFLRNIPAEIPGKILSPLSSRRREMAISARESML